MYSKALLISTTVEYASTVTHEAGTALITVSPVSVPLLFHTLPEKKETWVTLSCYPNGRWTEGMKAGYNTCLDEILEERKE